MCRIILYIIISGLKINKTFGIIAYDCSHDNINITSINNTLHVEKCPKFDQNINIVHENIYLMQRAEIIPIHVYQCKISISQFIKYCGWNSYDAIVSGGISTFVKDIDRDSCIKLHQTGYITLDNGNVFQDIKSNATSSYTYTAAGWVTNDGACTGTSFSQGGQTWHNVVVLKAATITLTDYNSYVKLEENVIALRDGLTCPYLKSSCMDANLGMTYWTTNEDNECATSKYNVLYKGKAEKAIIHYDDPSLGTKVIYSVNEDGMVFAMTIVGTASMCLAKAHQTEHSRIIILPMDTYKKTNKCSLCRYNEATM